MASSLRGSTMPSLFAYLTFVAMLVGGCTAGRQLKQSGAFARPGVRRLRWMAAGYSEAVLAPRSSSAVPAWQVGNLSHLC